MSRALAALCLGVALAASLTRAPLGEPSPAWLLAALAALLLELGGFYLPTYGWLSAAPACYLALAFWAGPAVAGVTCLAVLLVRALFLKDVRGQRPRYDQLITDALPILAAALAVHPAPAFAVFAVVTLLVVPWLQKQWSRSPGLWEAVYLKLRAPLLGIAACGLGMAAIGPNPNALWPLVGAFALAYLGQQTVMSDSHEQRLQDESKIRALEGELRAVAQEAGRVTDALTRRLEEIELLRDLSAGLGRRPPLAETLRLVREMADRVTEATSVAIFLVENGELVPASYQGPASKQLEDAGLLQMREPIVEEALRRDRTLTAQSQPETDPRLFAGEQSAVAIPLRGQGVLYVGDPRPGGFPPERLALLGLVGELGAAALDSALSHESEQEALQRHARLNARLKRWAEQVGRLLEGARMLAARLEMEDLSRQMLVLLSELLPHDACLALTRVTGEEALLTAVSEAVQQGGAPLLIEDLAASRFGPLCQHAQSLVAAPLPGGALVVASNQGRAYSRLDQDILSLLAHQSAAWLENVRLHQEVLRAYHDLQASEQQLIHSGKMAAVGQLAAGVAHEINTPLGVMRLGIGSALRSASKNPERIPDKLASAMKALDRAQEIVSKLLYYSRDARRDHQDFDLNDVVRDTIEFLGYHLREGGLTVEAELGEPLVVRGNQNELQQVLTNLLLNARDALADSDDRRVEVRTYKEDGQAVMEVGDQGPGMTVEVQSRIFEPFFTTREVGKGTGLGLSISLQIVEKHGGAIKMRSQPGSGTVFTVSFPQIGNEASV